MFELIEKIRRKSERQKKFIAFGFAFSISVVILLFWIINVIPDLNKQNQIDKKVKALQDDPSDSLGSIIFSGGGAILEQVGKIKETLSEYGEGFTNQIYFNASNTNSSSIEPNFLDENINN